MFKLRDYQQESVDAVFDFLENNEGNPILCLPTAAGKSVIISEIIKNVLRWNLKVLMVTHVKELIEQNHAKMPPEIPCGIYSAGVGRKESHRLVTFCGIQSIYRKAALFAPVDLVIIDECHLLSPKNDAMYQSFLNELLEYNPKMRIIGLSATPYRTQGVLIGKGSLFTDIAYEVPIQRLIDDGYLTRLKGKQSATQADMSNVKTVAGDWNKKQMAEAFDKENITRQAVAEIKEYGKNRKSWLIFGSSIQHCEHIQQEMGFGELITGETDKEERERILNAFKNGHIKCLINYGVLTTGFDAPIIDLIALMRSTKSTSLYVQMLGRGMRIAPNKKDCLILDYGGNIERHGPVDAIRIKEKRQASGKKEFEISVQPTKICPNCRSDSHVKATQCNDCGYEFPVEVTIDKKASEAAVMSADAPTLTHKVQERTFKVHNKPGKPPSLMVTYYYGMMGQSVSEWICFEHGGYATRQALAWWSNMCLDRSLKPSTTKEALDNIKYLKTVEKIEVRKEGKYDRIKRYHFGKEAEVVTEPSGNTMGIAEDERDILLSLL